MKLRWFGTATMECICAKKHILIDPYFVRGDSVQNRALRAALGRADLILISHPHLDHFSDISRILTLSHAPVFVSAGGRRIAAHRCRDVRAVHVIAAGTKIRPSQDAWIRVWPSRHIRFDKAICQKTLRRALHPRNIKRGLRLGMLNLIFRTRKEDIFGFEIVEGEQSIFVLGSANLCEQTSYPRGMDCLIYPFQGRSDMTAYSAPLIRRLAPKRVILTHFDDSFPPISAYVDTDTFCLQFPIAERAVFDKIIDIG